MPQYTKPFLDIFGQIALLEARGMAIPDRAKAEEYLSRIGYYRLSAFWYPFRETEKAPDGTTKVLDTFKAQTDFKTVVDLYTFDKALRLQMMDALERVEISLRTSISLTIGPVDPWAHRDPALLDRKFTQSKNPRKPSKHGDWIARLDEKARTAKDEFAVHFRSKYSSSPMPIWIACELLDFGPLSILLEGLRYREKKLIGESYDIARPALLVSWAQALSFVRNTCAHHARLWNRALVNQPMLPDDNEIPMLDHVALSPYANRRIYAVCALARYLLMAFNPRCMWHTRLKTALATFPSNPNIDITSAGFPAGWDQLPLWK